MVPARLRHRKSSRHGRSGGDPPPAAAPVRREPPGTGAIGGRAQRALAAAVLAAALTAAPVLVASAGAQEPTPRPESERPRLPADSAVIELAPLDVRVSPSPRRGKMSGFLRRQSRGTGEFITREDIERQDPMRLSDMVHLRPGVGTVPYADGSGRRHVQISRAAVMEDRGACRIQYWIDGIPFRGVNRFELDELSPQDVEGIEIYRGPAEIPPQFNRRGSQCGVVLVWTRDPGAQ